MRKVLIAALGVMLLSGVGCQNDGGDDMDDNTMRASTDACAMCDGVQTAKADGTCPKCNMKVDNMQ